MDGKKRNSNCFYSIFAKKRNSHGHFKYIKKCCFGVITLLPYPCSHFYFDINFGAKFDIKVKVTTWIGHVFTKKKLFLSIILNLDCFYSIFAKKRNSHGYFEYIKKYKSIPRNCCFGVINLCSPPKKYFHWIVINLPVC